MYLNQYKIEGSENLDSHYCFGDKNSYPKFQEKLEEFKSLLVDLVEKEESKTFYKFGDGDYFFLKNSIVSTDSPFS